MTESIDLTSLMADFLEDASGHLDAAEQALLLLEQGARAGEHDPAIVGGLLGNLHTFKGNAGMMGFSTLQSFIHQMEGALKAGAGDALPFAPPLFEALFASMNALRSALAKLGLDPRCALDLCDEQMLLECLACGAPGEEELPSLQERGDDYSYVTQKSATLKINFSKLDELLNLVGELVIQRTAMLTLQSRLRGEIKDRELLALFDQTGELMAKSAADLRESIMKARMLPASTVFRRFNRLVRDLSGSHGKEVRLCFEGEDTELDKTVIDEIGEPLLHLIRNAVDHGIESPQERRAAGKPQAGTLTLKARHEKNQVVISLGDDGRGLDAGRLRELALARGVIAAGQAALLGTQESLQLIFLPGFSTSERLTETSGRGIGLDVVKKCVGGLGGVIEVDSTPGAGTTFSIKLPLTLAIIQALLVEVSGETFALPLAGVLESLALREADLHRVAEGELFRLRDRLLAVRRLSRQFGLPAAAGEGPGYLVVVESGEKRGGFVVDRLLGQQEVVLKGLDDYLGELPGISGATVLGDGRVALMLDIASLLAGTGEGTCR